MQISFGRRAPSAREPPDGASASRDSGAARRGGASGERHWGGASGSPGACAVSRASARGGPASCVLRLEASGWLAPCVKNPKAEEHVLVTSSAFRNRPDSTAFLCVPLLLPVVLGWR